MRRCIIGVPLMTMTSMAILPRIIGISARLTNAVSRRHRALRKASAGTPAREKCCWRAQACMYVIEKSKC